MRAEKEREAREKESSGLPLPAPSPDLVGEVIDAVKEGMKEGVQEAFENFDTKAAINNTEKYINNERKNLLKENNASLSPF